MNTEKDTPNQSETTGPKPKVTELYWLKTENATLTLERGGHPKVYRGITIIWEAERDEVPFSYEDWFSGFEGVEDKYARRQSTFKEDCVRRLFTFEEAQSVLSVLEAEVEGVHLLSRVSLPVEAGKLVPVFLSSNSSIVETGGLLVRGHYDLETATYVFEERDGMPYRTVQLDLPVELADRLERMISPEIYIARLEEVNARAAQLISDISLISDITSNRSEKMEEAPEVYLARLENVNDKVEQAVYDICDVRPDPYPYDLLSPVMTLSGNY